MPTALPIDNLIRPRVWMTRCPDVRVLDQRVEMFQKGAWWMPMVVMSILSPSMAFVAARFDVPQPFMTLFIGMAGLMLAAGIIIAIWWRMQKPVLIFHREKSCVSIPSHRLIVPFKALKQFRVRDVICPDDGDTTYVTAALIFDTEQPRESRCIYVWNRETLESAWKHFQAEVERMTDAPKLAQ